jgi:GntR family transcriptional repressor for pyruvate dehydrogenase complex
VDELGVSRTVVREAISRLQNGRLVEARQGSGVFVLEQRAAPLDLSVDRHGAAVPEMKAKVLHIVVVRRAVEVEAAGLAARHATPEQVEVMRSMLRGIDEAVDAGGDGVEEDLAFHRAIADASANPVLATTVGYLGEVLRTGMQVTRANEARRADFAADVRREHAAILAAVAAGDRAAARRSARVHLDNAARRLNDADAAFWVRSVR